MQLAGAIPAGVPEFFILYGQAPLRGFCHFQDRPVLMIILGPELIFR